MEIKETTLVLVRKNSQLLLGMKKRGFGEGLWNGFGGKIEPGESIVEAGIRELREEADIQALSLKKQGFLKFSFKNQPLTINVHVFRVSDFNGQPTETEEMRPAWFSVSNLPYAKMWPDDKYWLPVFLKNDHFRGHFVFKDEQTIINHDLVTT